MRHTPARPARRVGGRDALRLALAVAMLVTVLGLTTGHADAERCTPPTCDPGDDGGGGDTTTLTTPSVYIAARTVTSIDVGWFVPDAATSYQLKQLVGGVWSIVYQSSGGGGGDFNFVGLARDTRYCYQVVAKRAAQIKTSSTACAYTEDGLSLRMIWRVQVRITTGDVPQAGTSNEINVGVGGPIDGETGGGTWLDHSGDDFEPGATHDYDLVNLSGIDDLGDIESLEIFKPGTDNWCLANVMVIVNNIPVFTTGFGPPCQWVNAGATESVQIPHDALHSYPWWAAYQIPLDTILQGNDATLVISHEQIEGHIESQVGDAMVGTHAYWAPPDAVNVSRWDAQRAKVHLDLMGEVTGTNPDIDVDFDLVAGSHKDDAGTWFVDVGLENASAQIHPAWYEWIFVAMSAGAELRVPEQGIESALYGLAEHVGVAKIYQVTATFDNSANLVIHVTLQCPETSPMPNTCMDPIFK